MAFYKLANLIDLSDGCRISASVAGQALLLVQNDGHVKILEDRCPHMDAPLSTGKVDDGYIVCRAHGIGFCLQSGKAQGSLGQSLGCLKFFEPVYEGNSIGVSL